VGDEQIRAAVARGDEQRAFVLIYEHHGRALYTRCVHLVRDRAQAEDVVQDVVLKAFKARGQLRTVDNLRAWLLCIATRSALDALRRSRRHHDKLELTRQTMIDEEPTRSDDDGSWTRHDRGALDECLAALDPTTRAAFLMRYEDELPWEQIARELALPLDTIRMRVNRGAIRSLRACLEAKERTS
jgi:RNA polymerase sigma-70 factor (ECF subfamily)